MLHIDYAKAVEMLRTEVENATKEGVLFYPDSGSGCMYVLRYNSLGQSLLADGWNPRTYSHDSIARREPGCIIGRIMINQIGIPLEFFSGDAEGIFTSKYTGFSQYFTMDDDAIKYWQHAQDQQDCGAEWASLV